jgi:hypothetical protein
MKKMMLLFSITFILLHFNKAIAQNLKIEKISTVFQKVKIDYAPQKDTNSSYNLVTGYGFKNMLYRIVIKVGSREVYHYSYNDYAYLKVEYMGTDGKYYLDTPSIAMMGCEIPPPEEFQKWYSRKDTQIIRTATIPFIILFYENHKKYRFQIVYPYYTARDERSRKLLKSDWIYFEFEK